MSGGSGTMLASVIPGATAGSDCPARNSAIRAIESRQASPGRMSGGGYAWQAEQIARASCSAATGGCTAVPRRAVAAAAAHTNASTRTARPNQNGSVIDGRDHYGRFRTVVKGWAGAVAVLSVFAALPLIHAAAPRHNPQNSRAVVAQADTLEVTAICTKCHALPPPDVLPRAS